MTNPPAGATPRWQPFETVQRPIVPKPRNARWIRNPIDAFVAAEHEARQLQPRPEATREVLLRRVYLDLIGLSPTPSERRAFLADTTPQAYEKVVDRLLADPRHGERWGRHWMDVWRYSDWAGWTDGNQIRDSQPHIWRWRDWIVESLNADKGYNRMILEMLAADELDPLDTDALRATGFLARNYKMLSREQWLEDTVKHTAQAFLGVTMGCAKCHDHMMDPIPQTDYYRMRAIFEPHQVRIDKVPGQTDSARDGLVRVFDTVTNQVTYRFIRGDERQPDTNHVMEPGVPVALCGRTALATTGGTLRGEPVALPFFAAQPDHREFVLHDLTAAGAKAIEDARRALEKLDAEATAGKVVEAKLNLDVATAKQDSLLATLKAEQFEDAKESLDWKVSATNALVAQRLLAAHEARLKVHQAQSALDAALAKAEATLPNQTNAASTGKANKAPAEKTAKAVETATENLAKARKQLAEAEQATQSAPSSAYAPRVVSSFPSVSTGRRLGFARWIGETNNPLTARVAMNHVWLRHFGRGIVGTPADFGRNGRAPSHPQLLDWLAAEFMERNWSMKSMHRLIVTSSAYRMASTPDDADAARDPDNVYLWRMNSRRLEAEAVRDNLLYVSGNLDGTFGGPDIDNKQGLTSKRRSLYLRLAAEKEVEFLRIFDGPSVTECYERRPSVMPQQALALANSELALAEARLLSKTLGAMADDAFVRGAFERVLARAPRREELAQCLEFLARGTATRAIANRPAPAGPEGHARENLVLVLFNHNDFVTVR